MADLASRDIPRPPWGGVGEGWERIFNEFWGPPQTHFGGLGPPPPPPPPTHTLTFGPDLALRHELDFQTMRAALHVRQCCFFVVPTLVRRLSLEGPDSQVSIRILRSIPYGSAGCNSFQILITALMERDSPERRLARTRCNCWTPDALVMIFRSIPRGNLKLPLPRSMLFTKARRECLYCLLFG